MRKFEKVSYAPADVLIPTRADDGSAGSDFYCTADTIIQPGECALLPTYIKAKMNKDEVLMLYVRSSMGIKRHIVLSNGTGVVDNSYYNNPDNEGNIIAALYNYGKEPQLIKKGERIMQGVFIKFLKPANKNVLYKERKGGVGSTGK